MKRTFRLSASFGMLMELYFVLRVGPKVFALIDNADGVDMVIKRKNGNFGVIQIKASSKDVVFGDAAFNDTMTNARRPNDWHDYTELMDTTTLLSQKEFEPESLTNRTGRKEGEKSIWFNGTKPKSKPNSCNLDCSQNLATNFSRIPHQSLSS